VPLLIGTCYEVSMLNVHCDAQCTLSSLVTVLQMITDSHYVGEDYDVFGAWLGADAAAE
jgi:hypothetical protein